MGEILFEGNELTKDLLGATQGSGSHYLIAHWANGKVGEIVDLSGNNEYRFIEYYFEPAVNDNPHYFRKIYLTEEEILGRPIVVKGVIGYWLHKRLSSKFRFDVFYKEYYEKCERDYINQRGKQPDSYDVDMEKEFLTSVHLKEEEERINQSKAIFPFLRKEDNEKITEVSKYYIEFIKKKLRTNAQFRSAIIIPDKADEIIKLLHQLMDEKTKPKDVMMPIRAAMDAGAIRRPTDLEFCQEFGKGKIKSRSSINDYTNPLNTPYSGPDFEAMKSEFIKIIQ